MPTPIWSESYLQQLDADAELSIVTDGDFVFERFALEIIEGQSTYTLPAHCRKIIQVSWLGRIIEAISFQEFLLLNQTAAVVSSSVRNEAPEGTPYWYALHPTNVRDIRFYPTPNASIAAQSVAISDTVALGDTISYSSTSTVNLGDSLSLSDSVSASMTGTAFPPADNTIWGGDIGNRVIVSCWRTADSNSTKNQLPEWAARRVKKAYVLWKAYAKEGRGQDTRAAQYYKEKYEWEVAQMNRINLGCYIARKYRLSAAELNPNPLDRRPSKPILPSNYEMVRYR